jgi:hypothetical protein
VAEGTGEIVNSEEQVGGYPKYEETRHTVKVPEGVAARRAWLDSLEDAMAVDTNLDLSRLYGIVGTHEDDKFASPTSILPNNINTEVRLTQKPSVENQLHIRLKLAAPNAVRFSVFDLAGTEVVSGSRKYLPAGSHAMAVKVKQLPGGLYICRCQIGNTVVNRLFHKY